MRLFKPGDLSRLHEIREAAFAPVFASFRNIVGEKIASVAFAGAEQEQAALLDSLCAPGAASEVYVAERKGEVAGFCSVTLDRDAGLGEIGLNAVHPGHQGAGLGAAMYAFALDRMKEAGMKAASVGTGGDASHAPARRAYEKAGFGPGVPSMHLYKLL
ncbi:N-acetyltransferase [Marinicaulis flavus]|uniref:N-acetyltransferase n=1 Tax=Hyphococcus luteus TaxID=2058213 RepID=A0A2S7K239_9PROT|nr:N-acetyltransferase [Marinicaulis flavus]